MFFIRFRKFRLRADVDYCLIIVFLFFWCSVHANRSDVPKYKQRIAGKSLPMEKFAVKKSQRFSNQNNRLFLPAIELLYLWNLFNVFGKRKSLCDNLYRLIDKNTKDLEKNPGTVILILYNYCSCVRA